MKLDNDVLMSIGSALVSYGPDWCAGFFIDKNHIVTAGHCLRGRNPHNIETHLRNADVIKSEVAYVNFDFDIGILRTKDSHNQKPLRLRDRPAWFGESLQNAQLIKDRGLNGHMFNIEHGKHWALIDPKDRNMNTWKTKLIETTCHSQKGFSGSPFVDDLGHVVGVLVGGNGYESYGVPVSYIKDAMRNIIPDWNLDVVYLPKVELNGVW